MRLGFLLVPLLLAACGTRPVTLEDYNTEAIRMPNGKTVRAERLTNLEDLSRGMMFRESLDPSRGMLFVHPRPERYPYFMYQVRIPLDIVWLDTNRRVVEIAANVPPCKESDSKLCPTYGGTEVSAYVVELAGGMAEKYGVRVGSQLSF